MCFLIRSCGSASSAALAESHWWGEHEVRRGRGGGGWKVTRSHCIFMDESPFLSSSYSSSFGCLGDYQRWRRKSWNAVRPSAVKIISPILSIHSSFSLWPSFIPTSCEWVTAAREYKGTGSVEEAERRQQSKTGPWRLDVRGMLLSKLYHSVTQQDQSPQTAPKLLLFFSFALLLFLDVRSLFSLSVSHIVTIHHIWSDTELAEVILGAYLAPAF